MTEWFALSTSDDLSIIRNDATPFCGLNKKAVLSVCCKKSIVLYKQWICGQQNEVIKPFSALFQAKR